MKKIFSLALASALACGALFAQSLKVTNTFGGDSDSTGASDLFIFENQKEEDGSYKNEFKNTTNVSDRLQLDASGEKFDARVRLEFAAPKVNGKNTTVRLRGYGRFKPLQQFQLIAGNSFFTKVPVKAGYLFASDDYPKYARILQSGFGAQSDWTFGENKNIYANFAAGLKGDEDTFFNKDTLGFDMGFNFGAKDIFSAGASFQNITGNRFSAGAFAGLDSVENLTLNAGYIYNNTDTDFIAKAAKHSVSLTAGFNIEKIGLSIGADVISAIGNEYIKNGDTLEYKKDDTKLTPFLAKIRISYAATENVTVNLKAKSALMIGDGNSVKYEVYPYVTYKLPSKMGTLSGGVRFNMNYNTLTSFSFPLTWKCVVADIKK
ncbi:MAG: hypothetical protein K6A42_01420 [Treponema sp.]|nr:hypothetical protein [Treponema sp.]